MELVIPLMAKTATKSSASQPQDEPNNGQQTVESQPTESQPPIEPHECIIDSTDTFEPMSNHEIPDNIINEIMASLQNDPYLDDFFETIDIEFDQESPLERELRL